MRILQSPIWLLVLTATIATLGGCTGSHRARVELGWPEPPATPVVKYERSIHGTTSLKRSFFGRTKDFLFGRAADQHVGKPYGVSSDGRSLLYIADTGKKSIDILDLGSGRGRTIRSAGPREELLEPVNVIPDRRGYLYVADTGLGCIVVYRPDGTFSHYIGRGDKITSPVGMAIAERHEQIFVVDSKKHEVHIYTLAGDHVGQFGGRGDNRGEFYHPLGITINADDTLYVTDAFHFAVQAFDLSGNYLFSFGPTPRGVGTMARPRDVAVDRDGHVYVTDAMKHEVQVYDNGGTFLFSFGGMGTTQGRFRLPAGICITDSGRIFVADSINQRIQEFVYLGSS